MSTDLTADPAGGPTTTETGTKSTPDNPVNVSKLGYVEFQTPDVDRLVGYYTEALDFTEIDRDASQVFLTSSFDHHSVVVRQAADAKARTTVGWEIVEELGDAERRLRTSGYEVELRTDIAPATPEVLVLTEPLTGVTLHLYDQQTRSGISAADGVLRPTKLGHVASFTPSLAPMQAFYQDLLGFRWSDTIGDFFVFLRCNSDHHAANFMASSKFSGMHHVAYEMRDLNHLQTMLDHLAAKSYRLEWGPGRHGAGHNIFTYHKDPDGNVIELFTQLDVIHDEAKGYFEPRPWHSEFPQYPKTWEVDLAAVNSWGPINPVLIEH